MGGSTKVKKDKSITAAEQQVSAAYRDDINKFSKNVMPLLQQQIDSLDDNSMITQAIDDSRESKEMSAGMQKRNAARYGLGMSGNQRRALTKQRKQGLATNMAGNENNARLAQKDRNENVALGLATMGNNYRQQGMDDMMQAVGIGSNRAQANAQSASQARQSNMGTAASLATLAVMAF